MIESNLNKLHRNEFLAANLISLPILGIFLFLLTRFPPTTSIIILLFIGFIGLSFIKPIVPFMFSFLFLFSGVISGLEITHGFLPLAVLAILAWATNKIVTMDLDFVLDRQLLYLLGYLAFVVLSVITANDQLYAFNYLFVYIKLLFFYLVIINIIQTKRHVWLSIYIIIFGTFSSVLYGFYSIFFTSTSPGKMLLEDRLRGLIGSPNVLALQIVFITPLLLLLIFHEGFRFKTIIYISGFLVFTGGLIATFSRGGSIAFTIVVAIIMYLKRSWTMLLILALVLIFLTIFIIPVEYWNHFLTLFNLGKFLQDASLRERSKLLLGAIEIFKNHPFTGIGIGNFLLISRNFILEHLAVHNTIFQIASETGIFGVIFFMLAIYRSFINFNLARLEFINQGDAKLAIASQGLLIGFFGVFIACMFLSLQEDFIIWALMGFSTSLRQTALQYSSGKNHEQYT